MDSDLMDLIVSEIQGEHGIDAREKGLHRERSLRRFCKARWIHYPDGAVDPLAAVALVCCMASLSEHHHFASWLIGCEDTLLAFAVGEESGTWGFHVVTEEAVSALRRLARRAGGWWRDLDDDGPRFYRLDESALALMAP